MFIYTWTTIHIIIVMYGKNKTKEYHLTPTFFLASNEKLDKLEQMKFHFTII